MTVRDLLIEWARWHRANPGGARGYPSRTPFDRLRGSALPSATITDDNAIRVDGAVARLRVRCPDQAQVLEWYYLSGRTVQQIGRATNQDRRNVTKVLACAETAVEWILEPEEGTATDY